MLSAPVATCWRQCNHDRPDSNAALSASAGGGVAMSFKCTGRSGNACAEIVMRSDDDVQSVTLTIPVGPFAVDEFVKGLAAIESARGRAVMPAGSLQTLWR